MPGESEVLFTLFAEQYESRSLGLTSILVLSEWERIFASPMATAAIDRVVRHFLIVAFDLSSYCTLVSCQKDQAEVVNRRK